MTAVYVVGDIVERLAEIPTGSVDLVLTSPPFLDLRSYLPVGDPRRSREIGHETTPASFLHTMLGLTAEWRRVLAPHGTLAVEFGDTYSGSGGAGGDYAEGGLREGQQPFTGSAAAGRRRQPRNPSQRNVDDWPLDKSLALVPELYRLALAYGLHPLAGTPSPAGRWRVRNVVTWCRPNPTVGALGDKFRPATSDLVIACTAADRWFDGDAVRDPASENTHARVARTAPEGRHDLPSQQRDGGNWSTLAQTNDDAGTRPAYDWCEIDDDQGAPLDYWKISPGGYRGAHFAVYPPALCEKPVQAMCPRRVCRTCGQPSRRIVETSNAARIRVRPSRQPAAPDPACRVTVGWSTCGCPGTTGGHDDVAGFHEGAGWRPGLVLDPFAGSGTTLLVATGHGRDGIGIDLNPLHADLAVERLGMFVTVVDELSPIPIGA